MKVVIKGAEINTTDDFHNQLKTLLEFPDYYANNLDALWDCLTGCIEMPVHITWLDFKISKTNLGNYSTKIVQVFNMAEDELNGFTFELK